MKTNTQYQHLSSLRIGSFHAGTHHAASAELHRLFLHLLPYASQLKADMLISFMRKKSLRLTWVKANLPLAKAIVGSDRQWPAVQRILSANQYNDRFCFEFDAYIKAWCSESRSTPASALPTVAMQTLADELQP